MSSIYLRARATVHKNAMHGWGRLARAHVRARHRAQEHHDRGRRARARARAGVTMHKNFEKVKIGKTMIFKQK